MTVAQRCTAFTCCLVLGSAFAQAREQGTTPPAERTFAIVEHSSMRTFQGNWGSSASLLRYVHGHGGTYVVFAQAGDLYRLDSPAALAEVQRLYAPMGELSAQQDALEQVQRPLEQNQSTLGEQQRTAVDPQEKGHIGTAQGAVGQEQGEIGRMQGALGRQQAAVAKAAYQRMQTIFDRCLADRTCSRISS